MKSVQEEEGVRLMFKLRSDAAGLFGRLLADKKICRMVNDEVHNV